MSRSRRKPFFTDGSDGSKSHSNFAKRQANKKVRRYDDSISDGKEYRRLYCSWNIRDYRKYKPDNLKVRRK